MNTISVRPYLPGSIASAPEDGPTPTSPMSLIRVLLIDDSVTFLKKTQAFLESAGRYKVIAMATTGREGTELAKSLLPDLILLDLSLRFELGFETLTRLKACAPDAAIVILTMHEDPSLEFVTQRLGAVLYLPKALMADHLLSRLEVLFKDRCAS